MQLRLTALRVARGWSRNRLAQEARITASDVSKIENGWLRPYPSQLVKLAASLGLPADQAPTLMEEVPQDEPAGQSA